MATANTHERDAPPLICANSITPCTNLATVPCRFCDLVSYCSEHCRKRNRSKHRDDCDSELHTDAWRPEWETRPLGEVPIILSDTGTALWGKSPAMDILKLASQEGSNYTGAIRILFPASGDPRNLIATLKDIPETYTKDCTVVLNDYDDHVVARNVILLWIALRFADEPAKAVPMMIHIWYSATITEEILKPLRDELRPMVEETCALLVYTAKNSFQPGGCEFGKRSLRLILTTAAWDMLLEVLTVKEGMTREDSDAIRLKYREDQAEVDRAERVLFTRHGYWRVATRKFYDEGILLPHGARRDGFDEPNPTLFHEDEWPLDTTADPLNGWPIQDVLAHANPKNDLYGALYNYLYPVLSSFCHRISTLDLQIVITASDIISLPGILRQLMYNKPGIQNINNYFDRIDVADLPDATYLTLPPTLSTFLPLLKPRHLSKHATLLGHFTSLLAPNEVLYAPSMPQFQELLRLRDPSFDAHLAAAPDGGAALVTALTPWLNRAMTGLVDLEGFWARYEEENQIEKVEEELGAVRREGGGVVRAWPLKARGALNRRLLDGFVAVHGTNGSERFVQWQRRS